MTPSAVSQVVEQMMRVCAGLALVYVFYKTNLELAAAGATFGASAGMIVAMVTLLFMYHRFNRNRADRIAASAVINETEKERLKELIEIVIPITIGSVIMPLMMTHYVMLQRNLLYTGVTRAKKVLVLVGTAKAVSCAVRNVTVHRRNTMLKVRLRSFACQAKNDLLAAEPDSEYSVSENRRIIKKFQ